MKETKVAQKLIQLNKHHYGNKQNKTKQKLLLFKTKEPSLQEMTNQTFNTVSWLVDL